MMVSAALPVLAANAPTYSKDVAPIIQKNCEGCHRPGQIGPFPFTKYSEVAPFQAEIRRVIEKRSMPPWHAEPGYGDFRNARRLSDSEITTIVRWIESGTPEGDRKDLPPPLIYPSKDWQLGEPDLVVQPARVYDMSPQGKDELRCYVIPTAFSEDRFVQAIEPKPGNRRVVHHILVYTDTTGAARKRDEEDPSPGFDCYGGLRFNPHSNFGGWAPGELAYRLPEHMGRVLPKGADVVVQVHYHKDGRKASDRSSVGLYFNKGTVTHRFVVFPILNLRIKIPPGAEAHTERATWTTPMDLVAYSVFPHMHLLGREMRMTATFPDGGTKDLIWVKRYDFNWQNSYIYRDPIPMPKGTRIDVSAVYDNSANNANNPNNPLKEVRWGDGTTDEMLIGWISYSVPLSETRASRE